jgi:hypothetical protein
MMDCRWKLIRLPIGEGCGIADTLVRNAATSPRPRRVADAEH